MDGKRIIIAALAVVAALIAANGASATDVGQEAADQIDPAVYQHYLDDLLYTHNGDNRGADGPELALARENIIDTFVSFGLPVELQHFMYMGDHYNVIATQVGTKYPDSYFLIGSHYDSVDNPGADDNASGTALVMEVARVLSQYDTDYTIKYVAFDMEEWGLIGSYYYTDTHGADDILGMVSIDMIAYDIGEYACDVHSTTPNRIWANTVINAVNLYGNDLAASFAGASYGSDHWPFEGIGVPACLLIEAWGNPCYHQQCDNVDTPNYISYGYATDFARSIAGLLAVEAGAFPHDCDENDILDAEEIAADPLLDCDGNGRLDTCEYDGGLDCNTNGISDICDIYHYQTSEDCDANDVPDECEDTSLDCNTNGIWDACDISSGVSSDCNGNHVPDDCDIDAGVSEDCNLNTIPDDCELAENLAVVEQLPQGSDSTYATNFDDAGLSEYNIKQWDDFTLAEATTLSGGIAYFEPPNWTGFSNVQFLIEIADAPGGAEAGANVIFSATGYGQPGSGAVNWDFGLTTFPAGTYWLSVQAQGGYLQYGLAYWLRTNYGLPAGSEHYFHNPGGGFGVGTLPIPASQTAYHSVPADMAFRLVVHGASDCNGNGTLDECDLRDGVSFDVNGNSVPDECEDRVPPQPDPMGFDAPDGLPRPLGTNQITMTAIQAIDNTSGIEYMFSTGSGSVLTQWRQDRTLVVSGLNKNWPYSYKVKARDTSPFHNETAYSTPAYWTATAIETPAGIEVSNVTATSMQVKALGNFTNLNLGESGLYFELTPAASGSGANEWTHASSATSRVLSNLSPCTEYTLRVKARNFYGSRGGAFETPWTAAVTITTGRLLAGDCNCDNEVNYADVAILRAAFGSSLGDPAYDPDADVDANGTVDCDDWQTIKASWTGRRVPLFEHCNPPMPTSQPTEIETRSLVRP